MPRDCPQCSKPVDGFSCPACGWKDASLAPQVDRERYLCANIDRGHRCASLGTLAVDTKGNGPWYCHKHFPLFSKDSGFDPDSKAKLQAAVRKAFGPKVVDVEAIAERISIESECPF